MQLLLNVRDGDTTKWEIPGKHGCEYTCGQTMINNLRHSSTSEVTGYHHLDIQNPVTIWPTSVHTGSLISELIKQNILVRWVISNVQLFVIA